MIAYEQHRANPQNGIYHQWDTDLEFGEHLHDSFEFVCLSEGELTVTVDGAEHRLHPGQGILLFPNQIHGYRTPVHSVSYLCVFQKSLVGEFARTVRNTVPVSPIFPLPETDPCSAFPARLTAPGLSRYLLKSCLYELIHHADRHTTYRESAAGRREQLGQILSYIADHHTRPITMQDVAHEIGYDYHYLSNLLQKGLHTTFRTLLNEYRISHAQSLLLTGNAAVAAIAAECGYESLCSFNRNFKAITGTTPTDYRERTRRNA